MSTMNLSRMERRANERKAKRMNKVKVLGGGTLVALMAGGGIVSPAMASTSNTAEIVMNDYWNSETGETLSVLDIEDNGAKKLKMTSAERDSILRLASGRMQGSVELSMSEADKKKLADAGISFDIEASEKRTNARIAELNDLDRQSTQYAGIHQPELLVKYSVDKAKATSFAKTLGITDISTDLDESFSFGTLHGSGRMVMDNIMTDKVRGSVSGYKMGDQLANIDTVNELHEKAYDNDGDELAGYEVASSLYPVSETVLGGVVHNDGEVSNATTTLVDPYSDGSSATRQTAINSVSKRGFTGDISNCLTDDCGLYFAVSATSENGEFLLSDPVRLNVKSTVSAGKAPTTMTLKSGDKVTFVPQKSGVVAVEKDSRDFESNYFTASKTGEWQFASQFMENIKNLTEYVTADNKTEISGSPRGDAGIYLGIESSNAPLASKAVKVNASTVRITLTADKKTEFSVKGKALSNASIGKAIKLTDDHALTLEKLSDTEAVFLLENTWGDMTPKEVQMDTVTLGIEQILTLPSASLDSTGGYSLTYTKAPEPVEPKPTPQPEPEKPVEPKPEPEPEPEPKPLPKPEAIKDTKTGKQGEPVTVKVMENDTISKGFTYKAKSLRLVSPETKKQVTSYTFKGQGSYAVSGENVVFTPEPKFAGSAPVIGYAWVETNGEVEQGAKSTVQVTITEEKTPVVDPEPTPKPVPEKEKPTPKPVPTDDPKPVVDPEPTDDPTDDPKPVSDDEKPEPKPVVDKKDKVVDDKVTDSDGGKSDPEKVEEGINNSGANTTTVAVAGGGLLATLAGFLLLRGRKGKTIKPAKKH